MDELIAFVNARLAAQEAQAQRELEFIQVAVNRDRSDQRRRVDPDRDDGARTVSPWTHREITRAEWMLADVAAKRRIIELHHPYREDQSMSVDSCAFDGQNWPCPTVLPLALPYADHPDFRKEWRP